MNRKGILSSEDLVRDESQSHDLSTGTASSIEESPIVVLARYIEAVLEEEIPGDRLRKVSSC